MASIVKNNGYLYLSIYISKQRHRIPLKLKDTPENLRLAKKELPKITAKVMSGDIAIKDESKPLFEKYARLYLKEKDQTLKKSTFYKNKLIAQKAINAFGNKQVDRITVSQIKAWLHGFEYGPKTFREYLGVLKQIFDEAYYDQQIEKNPCQYVKKPKISKPKICPFDKGEVSTLLQNADGWFKNYLAIAFYTGMRTGEILALTWQDITFDKEIIVNKTVTKHGIDSTKTEGSERSMPIFASLAPYLRDQYKKTGLKNGYLFVTQYGEAYRDAHVISQRLWKPLLRRCGIAYRVLYQTRHTFATNMLQSGRYSVLEIAKLMGHSSPQMVLQKYAKSISAESMSIDLKDDVYRHNIDIKNNRSSETA